MAGVLPAYTTIYIGTAGQVSATLCHSSNAVVGEIEKFSISGGMRDLETLYVIGGTVDKVKPTEQFEVSFDVIVSDAAASTLDRYDTYRLGTGLTSATTGSNKAIAIVMNSEEGARFKVYAFNNVRAITWEPEMNADDLLRGTMSFKFSPTTSLGVANLKTSTCSTGTAFPANWT